ncbi:thiamine-phosphate kinase [Salipaludibacillus daqingensis]|uniref:thiamine-phosphate kinase n=1 Tax=Salipaludibacillus daqingensis TaxID=3041001 RepID=UPI002475489F|nr:thiamine-phosphate kinase [Salipaludibacillus daqingensis]
MNNEFDWIKSIAPKSHFHSSLKVGIGDDAAVYRVDQKFDQVVAVDTMVEGIHFKKETMPIKSIGYKALAVNLSDLAAMGAIPLYYLVSIAVPKEGWTEAERIEIYHGMEELASRFQVDLIGGDTVSTKESLVITVTVIGQVERGRHLLRSNAEEEDILFITGDIGLSAYGLEVLLQKGLSAIDDQTLSPFIKAHQQPEPQLLAGRLLAECGERVSLNDISDGIAHEAKEIAEASGVNIVIDWDTLPIHTEFQTHSIQKQEEWMLYGGEDFQLVGTISPNGWEKLLLLFSENNLSLFQIGTVEKGKGSVFLKRQEKRSLIEKSGYQHF